MYDFITLFLSAIDLILESASDSVRAGARLSGLEERMLDGTVDLTSSSSADIPMV